MLLSYCKSRRRADAGRVLLSDTFVPHLMVRFYGDLSRIYTRPWETCVLPACGEPNCLPGR